MEYFLPDSCFWPELIRLYLILQVDLYQEVVVFFKVNDRMLHASVSGLLEVILSGFMKENSFTWYCWGSFWFHLTGYLCGQLTC